MSTLDISTLDGGMPFRKSLRYCAWFCSLWFLLSLAGMVSLATVTGLATGAPATYLFGQIALGLSVYLSLLFLADRPFINLMECPRDLEWTHISTLVESKPGARGVIVFASNWAAVWLQELHPPVRRDGGQCVSDSSFFAGCAPLQLVWAGGFEVELRVS